MRRGNGGTAATKSACESFQFCLEMRIARIFICQDWESPFAMSVGGNVNSMTALYHRTMLLAVVVACGGRLGALWILSLKIHIVFGGCFGICRALPASVATDPSENVTSAASTHTRAAISSRVRRGGAVSVSIRTRSVLIK